MKTLLTPAGWVPAKGYAHGVLAQGRWLTLAGQIGWTPQAQFETTDPVAQARQALLNIRGLLAEAGAGPEHLVRMTWYWRDLSVLRTRSAELGAVYREVMGREYGMAMSAVGVSDLLEPLAQVEIEATAVLP